MLLDSTAPAIAAIRARFMEMSAVIDLISRSIINDPPPRTQDGGFIAAGFDEELDKLRSISRDGKKWIASLEAEERKKQGSIPLRSVSTTFSVTILK